MSLFERLKEEMVGAQRSGDEILLETLRFILAQLHNREIEKRSRGKEASLTDEEVIEVLRREIKKRKEAIALYKKGGREELAEKEEKEAEIIGKYVPAAMNREEIEKIIEELKAAGVSGFNALMKGVMQKAGGRAEGKIVAELIKEK
jgi:hypothetical protein